MNNIDSLSDATLGLTDSDLASIGGGVYVVIGPSIGVLVTINYILQHLQ